jgi:competence protein ComEA
MDKKIFIVMFITFFMMVTGAASAQETRKIITGKLNINEASGQDFSLLPGIGEKTGYRIVKYREEIAGFKDVNQIKQVKGIGDAVFPKIKDYLSLREKSNLRVLIDLNTATVPALKSLPGISEKDAYSIIEHRKKNKGFKKIEEMRAAGISKEKLEEIKDLITVLELKPMKGK